MPSPGRCWPISTHAEARQTPQNIHPTKARVNPYLLIRAAWVTCSQGCLHCNSWQREECSRQCAHLSVALPSSISPCRISSNSLSDSAGGRSRQGLGSRRSRDSCSSGGKAGSGRRDVCASTSRQHRSYRTQASAQNVPRQVLKTCCCFLMLSVATTCHNTMPAKPLSVRL